MVRWLRLLMFLGLVAGCVEHAQAATIFDNGLPDLGNGFTSDFSSGDQVADDFVLAVGEHGQSAAWASVPAEMAAAHMRSATPRLLAGMHGFPLRR